jgi:hypothetical protein
VPWDAGESMVSENEATVRLEGIVHAHRYDPDASGKQFLGAAIECRDAVWVIDYEEQSPFHAFAGRRVVASGEPYTPEGQFLIDWGEGKRLRHLRPSTVQPMEITEDLELVEVGAPYGLRGQFAFGAADTGESMLSFVTEKGDAFAVANDPAGRSVGASVEVWAYPVQLAPTIHRARARYLWIVCPCSAAELWEWRGRPARRRGM